jgi:hypothetical protein
MSALIRPTININGTHPEDLIRPRLDANRSLNLVVEWLKEVTPNGRDYPGDNERCVADRRTHYARIAALRDLQGVLLEEALTIKDQQS